MLILSDFCRHILPNLTHWAFKLPDPSLNVHVLLQTLANLTTTAKVAAPVRFHNFNKLRSHVAGGHREPRGGAGYR